MPLARALAALTLALASALPALAIADEPDAVATLAADPRVAQGTLEVDAADGSLLLRDAAGAALFRLPAASIDGAPCEDDGRVIASALERATAGNGVHLLRSESRHLVVALDAGDIVLLEHEPDGACWRKRSVFDDEPLFRSEQVLLEGREDTERSDETDDSDEPLVPQHARAGFELDATSPGEESVVLDGVSLHFERADGSALIPPLELVEGNSYASRLEWQVELGQLADGRTALRVHYERMDYDLSGESASLTHLLALDAGTLRPVLVRTQHDSFSPTGGSSELDAMSRDRDGRSWTLVRRLDYDGTGPGSEEFETLRGDERCTIEREWSSSRAKAHWQAYSASGTLAVLAERTESHDESNELRANCDPASPALLAAATDLRAGLDAVQPGTRYLYLAERRGEGEAASLRFHIVREVTAASRTDDGTLELTLEERGGAEDGARELTWTLDPRCIHERGTSGELRACRPEAPDQLRLTRLFDSDEDLIRLDGGAHADRAAWLPGLGPAELEVRDTKHSVDWSYDIVGVQLPDRTGWGEPVREPLVCDWDASEKARDGAIELALSGAHAVASRLVVEPGPGGSGMRARLLAADDSEALRLESESATLVRAKRWRDPAAGHETVVLQAEGDAGLEVHVLTLEGTQASAARLDFAPGDDGERDFATLLVATPEACALRVVRGKDDKSRVADYELAPTGPDRIRSGSLDAP